MLYIKTTIVLILSLFIFSGCAQEIQTVYVIKKEKIHIPETLLISAKKPKAPTELSEEKISEYIITLYKGFEINKNNINHIKSIVIDYNKQPVLDANASNVGKQ